MKGDPDWVRAFRKEGYRKFLEKPMPTNWATKDLENIVFENIRYYLASFFLLEREQRNEGLDAIELEVKLVNETILKTKPLLNKRRREFDHPESPDWNNLVNIIVDEIRIQEKEWVGKKDDEFKNMKIRYNVTNVLAITFKVLEIAALGSIAFVKGNSQLARSIESVYFNNNNGRDHRESC